MKFMSRKLANQKLNFLVIIILTKIEFDHNLITKNVFLNENYQVNFIH